MLDNKSTRNIPVLIVGAGPAGIAVAACLRKEGVDFEILEASEQVASAWHNHYDRLHLHTVKELSHLPHKTFPEDYPRYVSRLQLIEYFEDYVRTFDIDVQLNKRVQSIEKSNESSLPWVVETGNERFRVNHLVVCTGVNRVPNLPTWPGLESFQGKVLHSSAFKNSEPFVEQSILVVGMGNTGAELAMDLSAHARQTLLSVRTPVCVVPRDLNGRSVQLTARQLAKLPWGLGDWIGTQIRRVYFGNLSKYGLPISQNSPIQQLRETGKTPIVDIGTVAAIKSGAITVCSEVERFDEHSVHFKDKASPRIDAVILATGFRARITDFFPECAPFLDDNSLPSDPIGKGQLDGAYFVGFDNYKLGGILGTIQNDAPLVASTIAHKLA